jgi:transposase-like protein
MGNSSCRALDRELEVLIGKVQKWLEASSSCPKLWLLGLPGLFGALN